jgi:hypothetical protein
VVVDADAEAGADAEGVAGVEAFAEVPGDARADAVAEPGAGADVEVEAFAEVPGEARADAVAEPGAAAQAIAKVDPEAEATAEFEAEAEAATEVEVARISMSSRRMSPMVSMSPRPVPFGGALLASAVLTEPPQGQLAGLADSQSHGGAPLTVTTFRWLGRAAAMRARPRK